MELPLKGKCACGAVEYAISVAPLDAGYCHCGICRRASGAPVVAWGTVAFSAFRYTRGQPLNYISSARGQRQFCGSCGTQLTFQFTIEPQTIDFTLASLENPAAMAPQYHIWMEDRLAWFETSDTLPRHHGQGPDRWK